MNRPLEGRVVLIVGGTSGIGLATVAACHVAGARLTIVGPGEDEIETARTSLLESIGNADSNVEAIEWLAGDAIDPLTCEKAVERACSAFGRLDGLVHVAGGSGRRQGDGPLHELTDSGLRSTTEWNLFSVAYSNRTAIQRFLAQGDGGAVVNLGSVLADSPAPTFFATHAYAAAKAAIVGLSRSAASYYAPHGIRINVVAPGLVDTPMARRATRDPAILQYLQSKQPLEGGGPGRPDQIAGLIVFLLSDAAQWMTGQVIPIDGGWSVSEGGRLPT